MISKKSCFDLLGGIVEKDLRKARTLKELQKMARFALDDHEGNEKKVRKRGRKKKSVINMQGGLSDDEFSDENLSITITKKKINRQKNTHQIKMKVRKKNKPTDTGVDFITQESLSAVMSEQWIICKRDVMDVLKAQFGERTSKVVEQQVFIATKINLWGILRSVIDQNQVIRTSQQRKEMLYKKLQANREHVVDMIHKNLDSNGECINSLLDTLSSVYHPSEANNKRKYEEEQLISVSTNECKQNEITKDINFVEKNKNMDSPFELSESEKMKYSIDSQCFLRNANIVPQTLDFIEHQKEVLIDKLSEEIRQSTSMNLNSQNTTRGGVQYDNKQLMDEFKENLENTNTLDNLTFKMLVNIIEKTNQQYEPLGQQQFIISLKNSIQMNTREIEEKWLREPIGDEKPCIKGNKCEGRKIPYAKPIILTQFVYEDALLYESPNTPYVSQPRRHDTQNMCLMCLRKTIMKIFFAVRAGFIDFNNCFTISDIGNYIDKEGEYSSRDVLMTCSNRYLGLTVPVVGHYRLYYKQLHHPDGYYYYTQTGYEKPEELINKKSQNF